MKHSRSRTAPERSSSLLSKAPLAVTVMSFLQGALFLFLSALMLQSCKPDKSAPNEERPVRREVTVAAETDQEDLSFDPLGAAGDMLNIPEVLRDSVTLSLTKTASDSLSGVALELIGQIDSARDSAFSDTVAYETGAYDTTAYDTYRIQLFNSLVYTDAALERAIATEIFDYTVTLDYEVPYFKIRLGDFPDAKVAGEYLKEYVKPAGYPDSWVARVRVRPQKSLAAQAQLTAYFDSLRTAILLEGLDLETLDSLGVLDSLLGDAAGDTVTNDSSMNDSSMNDSNMNDTEGGDE